MQATLSILAVILLIIFLLTVGPFLTILALNTLFSLTIPFTFWTWLSTVWLGVVFGAGRFSK